MPRRRIKSVQVPSRERSLDGDLLRLHNFHVKAGVRRDRRNCRFCGSGLAAISTEMAPEPSKDGVVKGSGDNGEGATPPPRSDDGPGQEEERLPW